MFRTNINIKLSVNKFIPLQIRTGMVNVSDGKSKPEPLRLNLTMELVTLQRLEVVTPTNPHNGPPMESKVNINWETEMMLFYTITYVRYSVLFIG